MEVFKSIIIRFFFFRVSLSNFYSFYKQVFRSVKRRTVLDAGNIVSFGFEF